MTDRIVHIPNPPYYAVIAPSELTDDIDDFIAFGPRAIASAHEVDGFLGIETGFQPGFSLAVTYWSSLEAIDQWRHHPVHREAKARGMTEWFSAYTTRISHVTHHY